MPCGEGIYDAVPEESHRDEHFEHAFCRGKEIVRLIEDAVAEACSDDYSAEAVQEQWLELLFAVFLLYVEPSDAHVCAQQSYKPANGVPSEGHRAELECYEVRIPVDE